MKIIKNILSAIGILFVLLIVLVVFVFDSRSDFNEAHAPFVAEFMNEFSQSWDTAQVSDQLTNELLSMSTTERSRNALAYLKDFGKLIEIKDIAIGEYKTHTGGEKEATFSFKADFENGQGVGSIVIRLIDGKPKVQALSLNSVGELVRSKQVSA